MKPKYLFFIVACLFGLSCVVSAQKKIALIVAVSRYPSNQRSWRKLNSDRDLFYVRNALVKNGFAFSNIDTLTNENATKVGMVKALDALVAKASNGDIVYFHFSGHGQQIQDSNTDGVLDEADGYDEALIPYDAKAVWDNVDYHGEKHFRDDLLAEKLITLRKKVGKEGSVVVVIDACHSGTATRGAGIVRGLSIPCQQLGYKPNIIDLSKNPEVGLLDNMGKDMGSLVVFSGSSPNQVNLEIKDDLAENVGALSYAFAKAITNLPINCNYQILFEKVKATIQAEVPTQIPMFEGNSALKVFSNQYTPLKDIISAEMRFNNAKFGFNDTTFVIGRGLFSAINVGSTLLVYKQGDSSVYSKAVVTETDTFESICVAEKRMPKTSVYEVKIDAVNYGSINATYLIDDSSASKKIQYQLNNFLKAEPYLKINSNPDYTIRIYNKKDSITVQLIEKNDSIRFVAEVLPNDTLATVDLHQLLQNIKMGMRVRYLRKMQDGGVFAKKVKVDLIPVKKQDNTNEFVFFPDDEFSLVITNNNEDELYYTILDLLPNNDVKVLIPAITKNAADYSLKNGQSIPIPLIADKTSVTGKEFFKIIFSSKPLDLRASFDKQVTRRGAVKPMEKLIDDLFPKENKSVTRAGLVKVDDIGIVTVGFTVKQN